ncbi:MAG: histidinol-phosphate transaminase [Methanomicrobiales archaeon]|nr:histidinol-phosphate transaminase [Methanomicrobiales archaeon]
MERLEKVVHGGRGRWFERRSGMRILDFSASMNPFPPQVEWEIDREALGEYPDDDYEELKGAISRAFNRPAEEITVGNGSIEIIRSFCAAALNPMDEYHVEPHTFGEYAYSAGLRGAVRSPDATRAKVRFICNPNNPTGELTGRRELLGIVDRMGERGGYLFVDEAFIELSDSGQSVSDVSKRGLVVCRSLTKSFAVPGIRFGFGFADEELIQRLESLRLPWTVNAYAEAFAMKAMEHLPELKRSSMYIVEERRWLTERLREMGLVVPPSYANFILVHLPCRADLLQKRLLEQQVLVRDCTSFGLPFAIRIGVRGRAENERLIGAMMECLR